MKNGAVTATTKFYFLFINIVLISFLLWSHINLSSLQNKKPPHYLLLFVFYPSFFFFPCGVFHLHRAFCSFYFYRSLPKKKKDKPKNILKLFNSSLTCLSHVLCTTCFYASLWSGVCAFLPFSVDSLLLWQRWCKWIEREKTDELIEDAGGRWGGGGGAGWLLWPGASVSVSEDFFIWPFWKHSIKLVVLMWSRSGFYPRLCLSFWSSYSCGDIKQLRRHPGTFPGPLWVRVWLEIMSDSTYVIRIIIVMSFSSRRKTTTSWNSCT